MSHSSNSPPSSTGRGDAIDIQRFSDNPLIRPAMLPSNDGTNINGPSLIRVPEWVTSRLGNYYLYFAHHGGTYIRLAYADQLAGPWRIYEPGTLRLDQVPEWRAHIASPDVIVDHEARQFRMYFHGCHPHPSYSQVSALATSTDGLHFTTSGRIIAPYYLRVFAHGGAWYGLTWGGQLWRSPDGIAPFVSPHDEGFSFKEYIQQVSQGPTAVAYPSPFERLFVTAAAAEGGGELHIRHVAIDPLVHDNALWVYFSCTGGRPERIQRAKLHLDGHWADWTASDLQEVVRPELAWEGADLPLAKSRNGAIKGDEHALRDPAIFRENGRCWLLYCVRGEKGIAIAEIGE